MAEPLTSSDIIRERMGFGVSPLASGETRRAYAEAGLSPLGTQERERLASGGGISPMATRAEKDAWVASEVMAGRRDPMDLPKAYGGMGERPEATTRRGYRMQQEWDKQYEMMQEQQKIAREMEAEQRRIALTERQEARLQKDQDLEIEASEIAERNNEKMQKGADFILKSIRGGVPLPSGNFSAPILPTDPDAVPALYNLLNMDGAEHPTVQKVVPDLLQRALQYQEKEMTSLAAEAKADAEAKVTIAKDLGAYGMSIADFTKDGKIDYVAANEAIGKKYAEGEKMKGVEAEAKEEKKSISGTISDLQKDVIKIKGEVARYKKLLETSPSDKATQRQLQGALADQGILEDEINNLNRQRGGQTAPQPQQGTTGQRPALGDIFGGR